MAVSSSRTAASSISALTLSTPFSICFIDRIGRFRISSPLIATQPSRLTTLIDTARQAHHARLTASGFAVTISSARLGSIVPRTVAHHRLNPPLLLCRSEKMIRRLYAIGLVWTNRRFPVGPGPPRKDMYRARRPCTRRARSMRLPRTRKPREKSAASIRCAGSNDRV